MWRIVICPVSFLVCIVRNDWSTPVPPRMAGMAIRLFLTLNKDNGFLSLAHVESKVGTMP